MVRKEDHLSPLGERTQNLETGGGTFIVEVDDRLDSED